MTTNQVPIIYSLLENDGDIIFRLDCYYLVIILLSAGWQTRA